MKLIKRLFQKKPKPVKQAGKHYKRQFRKQAELHRRMAAELGKEWDQ